MRPRQRVINYKFEQSVTNLSQNGYGTKRSEGSYIVNEVNEVNEANEVNETIFV